MQGIAVFPQGLENEGAQELAMLGASSVHPLKRCASFEADMACLYRLHLQARLPFRLLREIARFQCNSPDSLYREVQQAFVWDRWLHPSISFRVDVSGRCDGLTHTHFTALQVKNALVDLQREFWGRRSDVNLESPDICLHLHLSNAGSVLSLDGSGGSLHRRGYRAAVGIAPLKENLAAGLIRLTGWDGSVPLVDPLCGSGTYLIEAASLALGLAPGSRRSFLLEGWADFDQDLWEAEKERSLRRAKPGKHLERIIGCEMNCEIAQQAKRNVLVAGLEKRVIIQNTHFRELLLPSTPGVMVCNPPYGKRIGREEDLDMLYEELGDFVKKNASGWQLWVLSGNQNLTRSLRMKSSRKIPVSNGGIDCRWLKYEIH